MGRARPGGFEWAGSRLPESIPDFVLKGRFDTTEAEKKTRDADNKKYGLQ